MRLVGIPIASTRGGSYGYWLGELWEDWAINVKVDIKHNTSYINDLLDLMLTSRKW